MRKKFKNKAKLFKKTVLSLDILNFFRIFAKKLNYKFI